MRVRVDSVLHDIDELPELAPRKNHTIEAVVDKIVIREGCEERLANSVNVAVRLSNGLASASYLTPDSEENPAENEWQEHLYSTLYACPDCGVSYEEVEPRTFSFNSPYGACPECDGVGTQQRFNEELVVSDWQGSPKNGAFAWLSEMSTGFKRKFRKRIEPILAKVGLDWDAQLSALKKPGRTRLLNGGNDLSGVLAALEELLDSCSDEELETLEVLRDRLPCSSCLGARLRKEALAVRLDGRNIFEICSLDISSALEWLNELNFDTSQQPIAAPIITEMLHRLRFLSRVGVGYLSLARAADSLSGGELQRVRLATSIGSGLVGVAYILDEPSIGLHQRDNDKLIESLRSLQQQGNTVIVVEHDEAMMRAADLLVDFGPGAGTEGGAVVAAGAPAKVEENAESLTAEFLRGEQVVARETKLREPDKQLTIRLSGAALHNLRDVNVTIPLGLLVGVTGVSGSGKSSLISATLVPAILNAIGQARPRCGPFSKLEGEENVDKLIEITQTPIGRSSRSTPATYCGVFDLIRSLWANSRDAKQRGFRANRFSFNAGDGRCAQCQGQGQEKIEMSFLPDLFVTCSMCGGSRFNRQTLNVRYREKNIADILNMSVDEASDFFFNFDKIHRLLSSLQAVGLGYITLGQSSSTLSGGEAQRIKLATELAKRETGRTIYFLDEPTTGLHFADVQRLIGVLDGLVTRGNTVIVIEHNLDVIKCCDWLIDLGPGGGDAGGRIIACGSPATVAKSRESLTAQYL